MMEFNELKLPGVWLIKARAFSDERGVFYRHFCAHEFKVRNIVPTVLQGNISINPHLGTLRGFHYQVQPFEEAKTISCLAGAVYDIVVDLRPNSPTYRDWVVVELSSQSLQSLHVPAGCANAWLTMAPNTTVHYYMSNLYTPQAYRGFRYDDPAFKFRWPMKPVVISEKDLNLPNFDPKL